MAIDRKDYQYIHNSLSKNSIVSNDNTLKVGSKVKNLLVELKEENIWNGDFQDYYGSQLPECWEPYYKERTAKSISFSSEYDNTNIVIEEQMTVGNNTQTYYKYSRTLSIGYPEQAMNIRIENTDKTSWLPNATWEWSTDGTGSVNVNVYSVNGTVKGILYYDIEETIAEDETVKNGTLYYTTNVKPKTSYVLQVINAILPSNITAENINSITLTDSDNKIKRLINFNQYIFFETGENEVNIKLEIKGLSYGYNAYSLSLGKNIYELRCLKTNIQAKVFLFESKYPWVVDNKGIITNLVGSSLKIKEKTSGNPIKTSFSTEQLESLFKEAPSFEISNEGKIIQILLPNSVLEDNRWKWKNEILWKYAGQNKDYPKIMDNIYLLAYRNFLTEEIRDYNNIKISTQYGLLRTIQKTCSNIKDQYAQENNYSIQLNQILLSGISPQYVQSSGTFDASPISFNVPVSSHTIEKTTNINLYILPLLGYNYTYGIINNKSDIYKYTAISFAWGKKEGNKFIRLSDFSIPIIVDRSIITINESRVDNTKYDLTPQKSDLKLTLQDSTNYYSFPAIYLEEVTETTNNTNE